jgi:riboflavin synthase
MFTGIVEELGSVAGLVDLGGAARICVRGPLVTADAVPGDSIAVNGVCLTVLDVEDGAFTADVMRETLDRSSLGGLAEGDPVNLERAATLATRLGGHLVQGHVDGVGEIRGRRPGPQWESGEDDGSGAGAGRERLRHDRAGDRGGRGEPAGGGCMQPQTPLRRQSSPCSWA